MTSTPVGLRQVLQRDASGARENQAGDQHPGLPKLTVNCFLPGDTESFPPAAILRTEPDQDDSVNAIVADPCLAAATYPARLLTERTDEQA